MDCGVPRLEVYLRIPLDLEDRLSHLIGPHADAGRRACGVNDDGSRAAAGLRFDPDLPRFELEGTFRVVRKALQREVDLGVSGIEPEHRRRRSRNGPYRAGWNR